MTQGKRAPMATWLKITIGIGIVGFVSFVGLITVGSIFLFDTAKKTMDPENAAQVSASVVKIDEPYPAGFKRILAVDVMGMAEVGFANDNQGLSIMFLKSPKNPRQASADFLIDSYVKSGAPNAPGAINLGNLASPPVVQFRGTMQVGGEEMPYAVASRKFNGIDTFQMVGCVVPNSTKTPVIILGQCSKRSLKAYPKEATKVFLASVKGF